MAKTRLDLITPYQSGDHADGGDFTFSETEHYDGGTFEQTNRYHHIYSLYSANISTDDVIITGIRVTNDEDTYLYGEEGYVLEIENNPFSVGKEQETATHLGQKIIGMRFRPLSVTAQSNPLIEAGDPAYVTHKGNTYKCFITNSTFTIGQSSQIACDAESYQGRRVQGLSGNTKAIIQARRVAKKEISKYDLVVRQFQNLMTHGFGLYPSEEVQEDGSTIYYMHDKPTIAESSVVWTFNENGLFISKDKGVTWGVDANGNMLANVLSVIGVNAEWINVLTNFTVGNNFNVDAQGNLTASNANITGTVNATSGSFTGSITGAEINNGNGTFSVSTSGKLKATNADITGKVNATSGSFTGRISSPNATITGGSININSSNQFYSAIELRSPNVSSISAPGRFKVYNTDKKSMDMQGHALYGDVNGSNRMFIGANGLIKSKTTIIGNELIAGTNGYVDCKLSVYGGNAYIGGNFGVSGTKARIVSTKNYGDVGLNAYETPRPTFADTGHARIGEDGLCYIDIDQVFLETIDHTHDYRHFLTKYGKGDLWIKESNVDYFIIEGTPNLEFDWKIEAIQKDYNIHNLEKVDLRERNDEEEVKETDYADLTDEYLKEYEEEIIQ